MRWTKDRANESGVVIAAQVSKRIYAPSVTEDVAFRNSLPIHAEPAYRRRTGITDANMRSASFAKEIGRSTSGENLGDGAEP